MFCHRFLTEFTSLNCFQSDGDRCERRRCASRRRCGGERWVAATAVPAIETEKADLSIVVTDGQWLETGISDGYHSAYGVAFSVTNSGQAEAPASQVTYIVHCGGSPTPSSGRYPLPTLAVGDTIHVRVPLDHMCEAGKEVDLTVWLDVKDFIDGLDEDNNIMKQTLVMGES